MYCRKHSNLYLLLNKVHSHYPQWRKKLLTYRKRWTPACVHADLQQTTKRHLPTDRSKRYFRFRSDRSMQTTNRYVRWYPRSKRLCSPYWQTHRLNWYVYGWYCISRLFRHVAQSWSCRTGRVHANRSSSRFYGIRCEYPTAQLPHYHWCWSLRTNGWPSTYR